MDPVKKSELVARLHEIKQVATTVQENAMRISRHLNYKETVAEEILFEFDDSVERLDNLRQNFRRVLQQTQSDVKHDCGMGPEACTH